MDSAYSLLARLGRSVCNFIPRYSIHSHLNFGKERRVGVLQIGGESDLKMRNA